MHGSMPSFHRQHKREVHCVSIILTETVLDELAVHPTRTMALPLTPLLALHRPKPLGVAQRLQQGIPQPTRHPPLHIASGALTNLAFQRFAFVRAGHQPRSLLHVLPFVEGFLYLPGVIAILLGHTRVTRHGHAPLGIPTLGSIIGASGWVVRFAFNIRIVYCAYTDRNNGNTPAVTCSH